MDFIDFIIARYNYWIVIILMMTGLYTVIARGNLVKKVIGLNLFQTSVFIFYITIGKIAGGTAPIYVPGDMEARTDHGGGHGEDHGEDGDKSYGDKDHGDKGHGDKEQSGTTAHTDENAIADGDSLHGDYAANDLGDAIASTDAVGDTSAGAVHAAPNDAANDTLSAVGDEAVAQNGGDVEGIETFGNGADALQSASDVIYSNPLPHVLILTAIVVGVATTAVGLALAVRVREAYGTIEEDELEAADNLAEFGDADPAAGAAA